MEVVWKAPDLYGWVISATPHFYCSCSTLMFFDHSSMVYSHDAIFMGVSHVSLLRPSLQMFLPLVAYTMGENIFDAIIRFSTPSFQSYQEVCSNYSSAMLFVVLILFWSGCNKRLRNSVGIPFHFDAAGSWLPSNFSRNQTVPHQSVTAIHRPWPFFVLLSMQCGSPGGIYRSLGMLPCGIVNASPFVPTYCSVLLGEEFPNHFVQVCVFREWSTSNLPLNRLTPSIQ